MSMYESEKLSSRHRKRRRFAMGTIALAVGLACVAAAVVFVAFGSDHKRSGCVIADVSESTDEARSRYAAAFARFATDIGTEGSGKLCLVLTAARPLTEGTPISAYVGPDPGDSGKPEAKGQIVERVRLATSQLSQLLAQPTVGEEGSGLVEAASVAADVLKPGDRLLFLSDGLQWSPGVGHLQEMELTPAAIVSLIRKLDGLGFLPDLQGVRIEFPFLLLHPGGLPRGEDQAVRIKEFWEVWADKAGAELVLPGQS